MSKKELKIEDQIKKMSIKDIEQLCVELEYRLKEGKLDDLSKILVEALLSYGKLTILGRAFPRVEDGLKPVHRRILYGMDQIGLTPTSPFKKCAKITGTIIAEYHPHGDCLSGDTEIYLMDGTIKTLEELTKIGKEVEVLSLNTKTNKIEPKIAHSFRIGQYTNKEYHIHLSNDTIIKATANHPLNILGKGWVKVENLETNMILESLEVNENETNKINDIYISKIFLVKVDNKPMYDFTVNGNENLYIVSKIENNKKTLINVHNSSVYDALVRMGQEFSLRENLIIGQGNFGSIEGDSPASSRYCVTGDTLIRTDKGLIPISKLVKNNDIREQEININVLSLGQKTNKANKFFNSGKHNIIEVISEKGYSIKGSENHPILTLRKGENGKPEFFWKILENINENDYIVIDRTEKENFNNKNYEKLLEEYFKNKTNNVPDFIFKSKKDIQKKFISSLFKEDINNQIKFISSEKTIKEIQILLLNFGIISEIKENEITILDKDKYLKNIFGLNITKEEQPIGYIPYIIDYVKNKYKSIKFETHISYFQDLFFESYYELLDKEDQEMYDMFKNTNYLFEPVKTINKLPEETVYSIRVDNECHSFIGNGIVNHNTEATVSKIGGSFFKDIDKNIVDFIPNYDETNSEPTVLPVRFPNLLVNGTSGIAVGMVSKVPTHNPIEVLNLTKYFIEQKKAKKEPELEKMLEILPAPDFPTGGIIYNTQSMKEVFLTGIAKMKLRAKYEIEKTNRKESIVITEIPYMVKIPAIYSKLQEVINNKKEEQQYEIFKKSISDIRNETSKKGLRIVIDLKMGVDPELIWNQLIKVCALDETISYYMNLTDKNGQVKVMGIIEILEHFISFRKDIIFKKYLFIKEETELELELVEGYIKALSMMDLIIKTIRESDNDTIASIEIQKLGFNERQTKAILNLRLNRLTKLEKETLDIQKDKLEKIIKNAIKIMENDTLKYNEMLSDLDDVEKLFERKERLTEINNNLEKITTEDLIKREECQIFLTNIGYVKRENISGKKSKKGLDLSENDFILKTFNSDSHSSLLFITDKGNVFGVKTYSIPDRDKGKHYTQLFDMNKNEKIIKVMEISDFVETLDLIMITKNGYIKRTKLSDYNGSLRKTGVIGIKLSDKDEIAYANIINGNEGEVVIINSEGKIIRFGLDEVPSVGRNSQGVIAMRFDEKENIISSLIGNIGQEAQLITISNNGTIKSTSLEEFKKQKRAGKGVLALKTNSKIGETSQAVIVNEIENDLIITTKESLVSRIGLSEAISQGKGVNGFKAIKMDKKDKIIEMFIAETVSKEESEEN